MMLDFKSRMKNYDKIEQWAKDQHARTKEIQRILKSNPSLETRLKLIDEINEKIVIAKKGKQMLMDYKIE